MLRVTRLCLAQNKAFIDAWGCVQNRNALEDVGSDPRRQQFMKLGDDLASQVAAKTLTGAAAAKRLLAGVAAADTL